MKILGNYIVLFIFMMGMILADNDDSKWCVMIHNRTRITKLGILKCLCFREIDFFFITKFLIK